MNVALVALDIAGTTVDEGGAVYRVLADVVRDAGADPTDADIRTWMGADKREAIAALLAAGGATPDAATVDARHGEFVARLTAAYAATPPAPLPGVPDAIAALRTAGIRVALTTGFDRQVTDPLLVAVGWRVGEHLDAVVCADEVAAGRPAPLMIERAMRLTGVADPARVLAAGDTALDVRAGHAAGAGMVVGVLSGAQTADELAPERPTHLLAGVHELPGLLLAGTR
ncbi:phosphonatase-like hydrolase [Pseudonocardia nigra]|uniref:phosphonatase-like hydrolase n=1 Tax=Pseudonocardia nigra TaxID=1921578 RepID=UPI001C5E3381|nr:phosphonatase-like hydrolase [Pseudonocardia nigra]